MNPQPILDAVLAQYPPWVASGVIFSPDRRPTTVEARFVYGTLLGEAGWRPTDIEAHLHRDRTWRYELAKFPDNNPRLIAARETLRARTTR